MGIYGCRMTFLDSISVRSLSITKIFLGCYTCYDFLLLEPFTFSQTSFISKWETSCCHGYVNNILLCHLWVFVSAQPHAAPESLLLWTCGQSEVTARACWIKSRAKKGSHIQYIMLKLDSWCQDSSSCVKGIDDKSQLFSVWRTQILLLFLKIEK